MKANKLVTALLFFDAFLMFSVTGVAGAAAEARAETYKHTGETGARVSMRSRDNSDVLWSADPQHGWIPAKEKHAAQNQGQTKADVKQKQKKQKHDGAKH